MAPPPRSKPGIESRVTRRDFLRLAGAGALAGASAPSLAIAAKAAKRTVWARETDVVVVGSGAAALSAAVAAGAGGAQVIVLEKARVYGGTTGKSAGTYHIPNNSLMRAAGYSDPKDAAVSYIVRCAYPQLYRPGHATLGLADNDYQVLSTFYDQGSSVIDRLDAMGALKSTFFAAHGDLIPDYFPDHPENKAPRGRALNPKRSDGSMGAGLELVAQLKRAVDAQKTPILLDHRLTRLVVDDKGGVVGAEAVTDSGKKTISIRARRGVVFGSGGFTHNRELRLSFLRGPSYGGCAVATNEGDFIHLATGIGAKLANMSQAWWYQVVLELALESTLTPTIYPTLGGDSMILVDKYGHRVVNEKAPYNERTQVHFEWHPRSGEFKNQFLFMLFDQRVRDTFWDQAPIPAPLVSAPYLLSAPTLEQLGSALDARLVKLGDRINAFRLAPDFAAGLRDTVRDFNRFAESGKDPQFNRGGSKVDLFFHGGPRGNTSPNRSMRPFAAQGPYYAIILAPGMLDTKGGPKINPRAQVLGEGDRPIQGLYAAGNCAGFPAGGGYWGAGSTLGPALTFGFIAGSNAARDRA